MGNNWGAAWCLPRIVGEQETIERPEYVKEVGQPVEIAAPYVLSKLIMLVAFNEVPDRFTQLLRTMIVCR
jgi:hypothetical protein